MNEDYLDLLRLLSTHKVRYMVIGGYAVINYTEPRYTKDLDLWYEPSAPNAKKLLRALEEFGAPIDNLSIKDLSTPGLLYVFGISPCRIDLLNKVSGVKFDTAWKNKLSIKLKRVSVNFVGMRDLKKMKKAAGRPQDLADLEKLNQVRI